MALTQAQIDQLLGVAWAAHDMVIAVARTGNGRDPSVGDFQNAWNAAKPAIVAAGQFKFFTLTVDSAYGINTGNAMALTFGTKNVSAPPAHGSGMTAWYAQNQAVVDGLPPRSTPATAQATITDPGQAGAPPPAPVQTAQQLPPQVVDAIQNSSGSTVVTATAVPPPQSTPTVTQVTMDTETLTVATPSVPAHVDTGPAVLHDSGAIQPVSVAMEPTPVLGQRKPSKMPMIAVGVAALGLAGGLVYTARTRGRRR